MRFVCLDQYGSTVRFTSDKHPRRALLKSLFAKSAKKMFVDRSDGSAKHIGYVVGKSWWTIFVMLSNGDRRMWDGNPPEDELIQAMKQAQKKLKVRA